MSARVSITIDGDRLLDPPRGAMVVNGVADYANACMAIRTAVQDEKRLALAVRHGLVGSWLADYGQAFGDSVEVKRYTPRTALSQKWQVAVPASISDAEIMQSRLLDAPAVAKEGQDFAELILEHFYGPGFTFRALPVPQLCDILNRYDAEGWRQAGERPLVLRTLRERLDQWHARARSDVERALVGALRDDPEALRRDLCRYRLLRDYPSSLGEKVLRERWEVFTKAKIDTERLQAPAGDDLAATEIEYYITDMASKIGGPDDLALLVQQASGYLDAEFRAIETQIRTNPEWITPDLLGAVELRFRPIRSRTEKSLALLRRLIKPAFPSEPLPSWNAERWLSWVRFEYMPFYSWLEAQDARDDTLSEYAATFADWYFDNFVALKNGEPERFAYSGLYRERENIKSQDAVTLVLLLDNFNFVHFEALQRAFTAHGITLASCEPAFSLVPTATQVCKAALITTTGDPVDLKQRGYADLVERDWSFPTIQKSAVYLPNIGAFQQLSQRDADIYFLNFLPVDEALHQDYLETGRPHAEVIFEHLVTVAQSIKDFATRFMLEKRLLVYVVSDHGSTRIAHGVVNVLDASYYKSVADKKHRRYLAVADDKFEALPQVVGQQCYLIDRHKFHTEQSYVAARRYYRFLETTEHFYVHGGLTPEEVVVPLARFTFSPAAPVNPTIRIVHTEYRYSVKSRVPIEIGNPNPFALEKVWIRMLDGDAEEVVDNLGAKELRTVQLVTTFRKIIGGSNERSITLRVRYSSQGSDYTAVDQTFTVTMKAMMEDKDDFSDLF
jgi:hypothetical protein